MREQHKLSRDTNRLATSRSGGAVVNAMPGREKMDSELMSRISAERDRSALQHIGNHYAPRLKAWLIHRGEQAATAEDIVQDVLVLVWTKSHQFDPARGTVSAWIYRMVRNCWIDHKRKHDRLQPTDPEIMSLLADAPIEGPDSEVGQSETAQAVQGALAELPLDQKNMLHMSFFEGLSHSQIAQRTGLPLGTVKSRIRAPLKKLRDNLKDFRGVNS